MRNLLFASVLALSACANQSPSQVVDTSANALACYLAADSAADAVGVATVLTSNPACVAADAATVAAIQSYEAAPASTPVPVVVPAAPVVAPAVVVAPATK